MGDTNLDYMGAAIAGAAIAAVIVALGGLSYWFIYMGTIARLCACHVWRYRRCHSK